MENSQIIAQQRKAFDDREPNYIRYELNKLGWEQRRLQIGDYWFFTHDFKKVGIERKTVEDLLSSLGERLSRQLEANLEHYAINILLLEGNWKKVSPSDQNLITNRGIVYQTWDMVWNYIRRFQDKGISLELTTNEGHTIHRLNELYALYQKTYSLASKSKDFTDDRVLAMPSGCRGKSGMKVIEELGSLKDVANAMPDELIEIEGIGKTKAQLIYNHFNRSNVK